MVMDNQRTLDQRGFTLIEMVIVLSVLAILAGVVSVLGMKYIGESKKAKYLEELRTVKTAVIQYYRDNGAYPTANTQADFQAKINPYLEGPMDDRWRVGCGDATGVQIVLLKSAAGGAVIGEMTAEFAKLCLSGSTDASGNAVCQFISASDVGANDCS